MSSVQSRPEAEVESDLPLNLFHVLEEEFVALHGPLPQRYPEWSVIADQVLDSQRIIEALVAAAAPRPSPVATPFSRHVMSLAVTQPKAWRDKLTREELPAALNELLDVPELYDWRVEVPLGPEMREFVRVYVGRGPVTLRGDDLRRFNRLLLEDAYPGALEPINEVRLNAITAQIHTTGSAALCLSGGGIRSGTFSLGILQGLAKRGLLDRFHYLSTVSGGGYIGSWLTAWSQRHPQRLTGVIAELNRSGSAKLEPGPEPVRHLREYSNFVAPRFSLISADLWSFVAIYLRNLFINWAALVPLLLGVLLIPRILVAVLYERPPGLVPYALLGVGLVLSVLAVFYITINRPSRADLLPRRWRARRDQGSFLYLSLWPTVVAGACLSIFWAWHRNGMDGPLISWPGFLPGPEHPSAQLLLALILLGIAAYVMAIVLASVFVWRRLPFISDLAAALFTGGGGGLITWIVLVSVFASPAPQPRDPQQTTTAWYAVLAVPIYLLVFFGAATVFVAATSKKLASTWDKQWFTMEDEDREWLGRHGGWLIIAALGWVVGSGLVIFGPMGLLESPKILAAVGGVSGLLSVLGGKSALTAANEKDTAGRGWKAILVDNTLAIAATVFIAVIVAALSLLTGWAIGKLLASPIGALQWLCAYEATTGTGPLAILYFSPTCLVALLAVVAAGLGLLASWAINLNKFSLHAAYRARIIRAFLGASRTSTQRRPNPFTGFDPQDNVQMHELRPGLLSEAAFRPGGLIALVVRLREAGTSTAGDQPTRQLFEKLSPVTQKLLSMHRDANVPSPSLTRNLLEDLNRRLDGRPSLLELDAFATMTSSKATRDLVAAILRVEAVAEQTNAKLASMLPRQGRPDMMLAFNRSVLDSVYATDLLPLQRPPPPYKLLHVVGMALNLVGGKRLAWQQRRAESFTASPLHCGSLFRGYRRTRTYGGVDGISLGTAVTISGAAVSSNMGYHSSSAAVTFVLTLFNARLGWWLGNPGAAGSLHHRRSLADPPYRRAFPKLSLGPLVMEGFGLTDDTLKYVLLSDGGHFDNLGLYEMVLRRCRFIVVVDGGQDENATFDDLGAAVRKIRIDLGVNIEFIEPIAIYKKGHPEIAKGNGRYAAMATIHYPDGNTTRRGVLLYIKPGILGTEPRDVLQYAAANPTFPHQTTADQLFDESQFESYRKLGEHVADRLCGPNVGPTMTLSEFARAARGDDPTPPDALTPIGRL